MPLCMRAARCGGVPARGRPCGRLSARFRRVHCVGRADRLTRGFSWPPERRVDERVNGRVEEGAWQRRWRVARDAVDRGIVRRGRGGGIEGVPRYW